MSILSQQKQSQAPDFPNVRPSLDLRFALAKKLDPRITFTRGSTGTYFGPDGLMKTAGVNEPRFDHDPVTGQSLGLLIEEQRINSLQYSNDFTNAVWTPFPNTIPSANQTGLDGTTSAFTYTAISTGSNYVYQNFTCTASTTYTFSFYVKLGTLRASSYKIAVYNNTGAAFIAVDVVPTQTLSSSSWTRVSYSFTTPAGCTSARVYPYRNNNTLQNNGTFYLWGAQVEIGAFPTSYIPTSGSTATRTADTANITNISSFFNASEGTLCVDSEMPYQTNLRFPFIGFTRGAGAANSIGFYYYNTSSPWVTWLVRNTADAAGGGTVAANLVEASGPSQTVGVYKKFIGTYKFGEFNYYFDGKYVNRRTTNKNLPSNLTYMEIGTNASTVDRLNGHIRRITYYPIQLTNQQLINLTS
jgi:hypothetical protein